MLAGAEATNGGPAHQGRSMIQDTISIRLNGDERQVRPGLSVAALLEELGLDRRMVVVEHNRRILERSKLEQVEIQGGDIVELVHFVGGG